MGNNKIITWYKANMGTDQGLIIDEKTGKNIAVSYDIKDADLIAAAPDLLHACKLAINVLSIGYENGKGIVDAGEALHAFENLNLAINKAEGKE